MPRGFMLCNGAWTGIWAWESFWHVRRGADLDLCVRDIELLQVCDVIVVMVRKPWILLIFQLYPRYACQK